MKDEYICKADAVSIAESYEVKRDGFHLNDYEYGRNQVAASIVSELEDITPPDVVPVVRCKDCKHWESGNFGFDCCWDPNYPNHGDDFCSHGEKCNNV